MAPEPVSIEYLDTDQTSDFIHTPVPTLYKWRANGTGPPARKVGKRLLYRRDELIAWVEAHRVA